MSYGSKYSHKGNFILCAIALISKLKKKNHRYEKSSRKQSIIKHHTAFYNIFKEKKSNYINIVYAPICSLQEEIKKSEKWAYRLPAMLLSLLLVLVWILRSFDDFATETSCFCDWSLCLPSVSVCSAL